MMQHTLATMINHSFLDNQSIKNHFYCDVFVILHSIQFNNNDNNNNENNNNQNNSNNNSAF